MAESKSESKEESKFQAKNESFMSLIQDFCMSSRLEADFEEFAKSHADVFMASINLRDGDEHPLAFHDVYDEYLRTFERKIERFIENAGYTLADVYQEAKIILDNDEDFGSNRFFLEALLATAEYDTFYTLMRNEMLTNSARK